ncbi:MAG TPA: hypothetical protein VES20_24355 [Bryobacteraceae bacterium]|nr:hypothetical protein [Bryobacteraceae bacterium]
MLTRSALARHLVDESQLRQRLERDYVRTGIDAFDAACQGIARGTLTGIWGPVSSGKATFLHNLLAVGTESGECCALIDAGDSFDPATAERAGADLSRLLWVRCRTAEQALKAADLLIHSGGWGIVAIDLTLLPVRLVQRIPMSWWYRFRRAVEHTPTAMVVLESEATVKNAAAVMMEFLPLHPTWAGAHHRFRILEGAAVQIRQRKPVGSQPVLFSAEATA